MIVTILLWLTVILSFIICWGIALIVLNKARDYDFMTHIGYLLVSIVVAIIPVFLCWLSFVIGRCSK